MLVSLDDYNRRVTAWLNERWPANTTCPMCQTRSGWQLTGLAQMPLRTDIVDTPPGRAVAVVPLTCNHCAYVVFLNAVFMGILEPSDAGELARGAP